ncbi:hypothetical protein [Bacillus velezensis]|uniref:hypothetical protein n=1 Tax=Bacillus velezensis TaxID=492670 RepID=UPI003CF0F2B7
MIGKENFYDDIEKRAQAIYEQYQNLMKGISKKNSNLLNHQLKFYLKDDGRLGGKAWCENDIDKIEINKGVINNFFDYFYDFVEKDSEKLLRELRLDIEKINEEISYEFLFYPDSGKAKIIDNKTNELNLASLLTVFVSRFILTHELGHLLNGHCGYLNAESYKSIQYIPMFYNDTNGRNNIISPLDNRTLEMDADAFATTDNFRNLVLLYNKFEEKVNNNINIKPIDLFYWWSFAIRSNFLIIQRLLSDEEYRDNKTHLPSVARWSLIIGSLQANIESGIYKINYRNGDSKEKFLQAIIKGGIYAEKCYNEKFFTDYNWIKETIENEEYKCSVTEIKNNWKIISGKLSCFSKLPLYESNY